MRRRPVPGGPALALVLAFLPACAGPTPAPEPPAPAEPPEASSEPEEATPPAPASVLRAPADEPALLDDADPATLRTAVGRSLDWLDGVSADSVLDFGACGVPAGALARSLRDLHAFLAGDPAPATLAAWVRERFDVVESVGGEDGDVLFTGYFEPVIPGAPRRTPEARVPVYRRPDDLVTVRLREFGSDLPDERLSGRVADEGNLVPYHTRREIVEEDALEGRGLEIAWVEDRVDLFFVQVQGSGAVRFPDGGEVRIGYAASNGRPYRSIGRLLIDEGRVPEERMSMQAIRAYLERHPDDVSRVLNHNPSYVFFRVLETPPLGSLGVPVTGGRSIATDYRLFPRAALAFIVTTRPALDAEGRVVPGAPLRRFVLNQDTGGAIRGPGRADVYWGRGPEAAETAGRMQQRGRLLFLVPREACPRPAQVGS